MDLIRLILKRIPDYFWYTVLLDYHKIPKPLRDHVQGELLYG